MKIDSQFIHELAHSLLYQSDNIDRAALAPICSFCADSDRSYFTIEKENIEC